MKTKFYLNGKKTTRKAIQEQLGADRLARMLKEEQGIVLPMDRVNVNGSGISLGHPVGCTALRIVVTMLYEMRRSGFRTGGASLCVGSGPSLCSLWTRDI